MPSPHYAHRHAARLSDTYKNSEAFLLRISCNPRSHRFVILDEKSSCIGLCDWLSPEADPSRKRKLTMTERLLGYTLWIRDSFWSLSLVKRITEYFQPASAERGRRRGLVMSHVEQVKKKHYPEYMKPGGYWQLGGLYIREEHTRKGLGGTMLEWGLKRADEDDKAIVVFASEKGYGLYKKHGFVIIEQSRIMEDEVDGGIFHCTMVRPPKSMRAISATVS